MMSVLLPFLLCSALAEEPSANKPVEPEAPEEEVAPAMTDLIIDAKVPVEVVLDNVKAGDLWMPGRIVLSAAVGTHSVRVFVGGTPRELDVTLRPEIATRVLVGRTGMTVDAEEMGPKPDATTTKVDFRAAGREAVQVRVGKERHILAAGGTLPLTLPAGEHPLSIRSVSGTAIWASGRLVLVGGEDLIIHVVEGRLPELSSGQSAFYAGR